MVSLDESVEPPRKTQLADAFLTDSAFVSDLRVNPLMLSLMCGIYASENYIPRNRPDVYEKCALLLFDRWDKQRGIKSELAFDAHVQAAMRSLALWMYPKQEVREGIRRDRLIEYMKGFLLEKRFDDEEQAEDAATQFIEFCKGRAWVLTDVGAELYGFTHRTFLEYFAASQLVRLNASAHALFEALEPHLRGSEWDVVAQLALQILGRTVEDGADDFLAEVLNAASSSTEADRVSLLSFASRALTFIVPRPSVLRTLVAAVVRLQLDAGPLDLSFSWRRRQTAANRPLVDMMGATNENLPLVSRYLLERV